jgi:hypothetical protein
MLMRRDRKGTAWLKRQMDALRNIAELEAPPLSEYGTLCSGYGPTPEADVKAILDAAGKAARAAMRSLACPRCGARVDPMSPRWMHMDNRLVDDAMEFDGELDWYHLCLDLPPDQVNKAVSVVEWDDGKMPHARLQPLILRCTWLEKLRHHFAELGSRATHHEERRAEARRLAGPPTCFMGKEGCSVYCATGVDIGEHWPPHDRWGEAFPPPQAFARGCTAWLEPDTGRQEVSE